MKRKDWYVSISAGVLLGILIAVFQLVGYQNVNAANNYGGAEIALNKTLQSYKTWSSLQGEARLVEYDADNKPHTDVISVKIVQPLQVNVSFKSSDDASKAGFKLVADGNNLYQLNENNLSYTHHNLPTLAHFKQEINFIPGALSKVIKDEVYEHPATRLISSPIMAYVYPVSLGQAAAGSIYKLLGVEKILGRATWKVSLQTKPDYVVAWVDQATGIILKYVQYRNGEKYTSMQFISIKLDQKIADAAFSAPDITKYQLVTNPSP